LALELIKVYNDCFHEHQNSRATDMISHEVNEM